MLISLFNDLMDEHPDYRAYIPELTEETVRGVLDQPNMKVRSQAIVDLVMKRYDLIK